VKEINAQVAGLQARADAIVAAACDARGIPPRFRPRLHIGTLWLPRDENATAERRTELRRLAVRAANADEARAIAAIDERALEFQERLTAGVLQSDEARRLQDLMPKVADMMPPLTIKGVEQMAAALGARSETERERLMHMYGLLGAGSDALPALAAGELDDKEEDKE
jgi:hypothetical protein